MVSSSRYSRKTRLLAVSFAGLLTGCSMVPKSRLDECHQMNRTLQADNSRLKDTALSTRSQYNDLAQRADDDARRLKLVHDENRRLAASVQAYQEDRDQLAAAFERLKQQVQVAANPVSTVLVPKFETFAKSHSGWDFDPNTGIMTVAADRLFQPGSDIPKAEAKQWLRAYAELINAPEAANLRLRVSGHTDDSPVQRTGTDAPEPTGGRLSVDRASRVRELLTDGHTDRNRIEIAGFEASRPRFYGSDETSRARNRRIEIELIPDPNSARSPTAMFGVP